jgi:hypothetical protein
MAIQVISQTTLVDKYITLNQTHPLATPPFNVMARLPLVRQTWAGGIPPLNFNETLKIIKLFKLLLSLVGAY